jgi:hypothetical protein
LLDSVHARDGIPLHIAEMRPYDDDVEDRVIALLTTLAGRG